MREPADCYGSLFTTRLVLWRISGTDQKVWMSFQIVREFLQIFRDFTEILEHLIDIFGIYIERLIQPSRERGDRSEHMAEIQNSLMNIRTIFGDQRVNVIDCIVCFGGSLAKVVEHRLQSGADVIQMSERGFNLRAIFFNHSAPIG